MSRPELATWPEDEALALREAEERWLAEFFKDAWAQIDPDPLIYGWHLDAMAEHLEAVTRMQIRRLAITVPPGFSKSMGVSVMWPAWCWIKDPGSKWLNSAYAQGLATRDAVRSRRLIESRWYQENWGHCFRLTSDQNEKTRYDNNRGGFRIAASVGGVGTGERGHYIVVDDPHNVMDAYSDAKRETARQWWDTVMSTRIADPERSRHVIVMQRIAEDDLVGHVLSQGGYDHLCLPMEYDRKRTTLLGQPDKRTKAGQLLHPERFNDNAVRELKKRLGSFAAAAQLQQSPAPAGGGTIKRSWWRYWDVDNPPDLGRFEMMADTWDMSFKDLRSSDPVAGLKLARIGADVLVLDVEKGLMDMVETLAAVRALASRGHPRAILVEDKANGPAVVSLLRHELPGILALEPQGSKEARVAAVCPAIEAGNVLLPGKRTPEGWVPAYGWVADLIHEAAMFPTAGVHDDQVDALAQGLNWMREGVYAARARQRREEEESKLMSPVEAWRQEMAGKIRKKIKDRERQQRAEDQHGGGFPE